MDDKRFDDIIRGKLGEYEVQDYDASALDALHHQMGSVLPSPWYSRHRTELVTGSAIVVSTVVILLSLWLSTYQTNETWDKNASLIALQQVQIDNLTRALNELRALPKDTLYVQKENMHPGVAPLLNKIENLERAIKDLTSKLASIRNVESNDPSPIRTSMTPAIFYPYSSTPVNVSFNQHSGLTGGLHDEGSNKSLRHPGKFSADTQRALEKHYQDGIGVRVGPALELSKGFYEAGTGRLDFSGGLLSDLIVSPSFSIETGVKFSHRFYEIHGNALASSRIVLPNTNPDLGSILIADVDSWMLEVPVNLKYRAPLSPRAHWHAGIGYASLFMTKQIFEYDYQLDGNQSARVNESHNYPGTKVYPGMLNISFGFSNQVKNNKILETSLYYQFGLGARGREDLHADYLGLRTAYWFNVR